MMADSFQTFLMIMLFYILLSYVIGPMLFYYFVNKSLLSAGNGFVAGSILSIVLWYTFGSKMINK
jgi:hypothetical protein